jgi:hypothetical protein
MVGKNYYRHDFVFVPVKIAACLISVNNGFPLKGWIFVKITGRFVTESTPRKKLQIIFLWSVSDYYCILHYLSSTVHNVEV